jgi:hypothetical protein
MHDRFAGSVDMPIKSKDYLQRTDQEVDHDSGKSDDRRERVLPASTPSIPRFTHNVMAKRPTDSLVAERWIREE